MALKRLFDVCFSFLGLIVSLPLWLIFGLLIFLEDGPPIFYLQERIGKDGRVFKGIKFRSMVKNAEEGSGPIQAREDDPRATRMGKFLRKSAMDELPQLINILKGDMSFVGPRALRPFEIELRQGDTMRKELENSLFFERSGVIPGLTGVAQIFSPRDTVRVEKFRYDLWYIKNRGIFLDFRLIFLSFLITFLGKWETRIRKFNNLSIYNKLRGKIQEEIWQAR